MATSDNHSPTFPIQTIILPVTGSPQCDQPSTQRFTGLDGLRAIFCIGIVLYHINESFHSIFSILLAPVYCYGGYFGNYIFFMISGLLISSHYKKKICQKEIPFKMYMYKRIFKLYPLYFLSNLAMVLLLLIKGDINSLNIRKLFSTFLMVSNGQFSNDTPYNLSTWFLCVLLICYAIYYFVSKISARFPRLYLPLCVFLIFWGALLESTSWNFPFHYRTNGEGYMNFFIGVILSEIITHPDIKRNRILLLNIASLTLIYFTASLYGFETLPIDTRWVITLLCVNLIFIAIYSETMIKLATCSSIQNIGKCSLSIFMWHIPVVHWLFYLETSAGMSNINPLINIIVYFVLLSTVSHFSYQWLEKSRYKHTS